MRAVTLTILAAAAMFSTFARADPARAQSFDCEAAFERVEDLICTDERLSALDKDISDVWLATIDTAAEPAALIRSQRAWIRRRNACLDRTCVAAAYAQRKAVLQATPRAGWAVHRDPAMGLAFEYLANREVKPCPEAYDPCTAVYGYLGGQPNVLLVAFQVFDGSLEEIARREAGFEPRDGGWFTTFGRFEPQPVEQFRKGSLSGMQATVTCGITDATGFHAAAGECYYGVFSDGRRSIVATTEGVAPDESTH